MGERAQVDELAAFGGAEGFLHPVQGRLALPGLVLSGRPCRLNPSRWAAGGDVVETIGMARRIAAFDHVEHVEVFRPDFEPLASLVHLDVESLAALDQGEIEVGFLCAGSCRRLVVAQFEKGFVSGIAALPCDCPPLGLDERPGLASIAREALNLAQQPQPATALPLPVRQFVEQLRVPGTDIDIDLIIEPRCITFCIDGWCLFCCSLIDTIRCSVVTFPEPPPEIG